MSRSRWASAGCPGGVAQGTINEVTVSITDNDAPSVTVRFERTTYTIDEGDSFSINVILSPDPERTVTIPIEFTIEDAAGGRWGLPGSVTFNDGQTTQGINFTATNDDVDDDSGQVIVRFDTSSLDNVGAGNETTVRITDDDTRGVTRHTHSPHGRRGRQRQLRRGAHQRTDRRRHRGDHGARQHRHHG